MSKPWKTRLSLCLTQLLKPKTLSTQDLKKILVITTTALGDTLWATPALETLRKNYPYAMIVALTSELGKEALQNNPNIDEILTFKEPLFQRFFSLLKMLKTRSFDLALILHSSQSLILPLCTLAGIPRIVGTRGQHKGFDELLTDSLEPHHEHEIARRLRILNHLRKEKNIETLSYFPTDKERKKANNFLKNFQRPFIVMHPGSKEPFRRWPEKLFALVGDKLQKKFRGTLFLTGTAQEKNLLESLKFAVPCSHILTTSSVRDLAALLEQMDLLLSNDTGPFHLACALRCPAVGLYVSTDPELCGPYKAPHAIVISKKPTCSPCIKRKCKNPFCFLQILPNEVITTCEQILKKTYV